MAFCNLIRLKASHDSAMPKALPPFAPWVGVTFTGWRA
jgi:hypothetical protein